MQIVPTEDKTLEGVAEQLDEGKSLAARGDRLTKAAKGYITAWLSTERKLDVDKLPVGSVIMIQVNGKDCIKVERKGQNRLDVTWLQTAQPEIAKQFTVTKPATYFDPVGVQKKPAVA